MRNLIPKGVDGIYVVVKNTCDDVFTYKINGPDAAYMGCIDAHETEYGDMKVHLDLALHSNPEYLVTPNHCMYSMVRDHSQRYSSLIGCVVFLQFSTHICRIFTQAMNLRICIGA